MAEEDAGRAWGSMWPEADEVNVDLVEDNAEVDDDKGSLASDRAVDLLDELEREDAGIDDEPLISRYFFMVGVRGAVKLLSFSDELTVVEFTSTHLSTLPGSNSL